MNLFDLYENREPYQQAIDKLEQRRIEDLEAKMDDYAQRGMKDEFQKCKAERDSYHKIKETHDTTEKNSSPVAGAIVNRIMRQRLDLLTQYGPKLINAAVDEVADYVGDVDEIGSSDVSGWVNQVERMLKENPPEAFAEGGIGQDLVTPQQRVQQSTPPKQTPAGKVASTVKNAAKWLAGRGGPGKEGPTYEEAELDEQQTASNVYAVRYVWSQIIKAVADNVDFATITWPNGQTQKFTRNQLWHLDQKPRTMSRQAKNQWALKYLSNLDNLMYYLGNLKTGIKPRPQLKPPVDPAQPQLDLPKPLEERGQKKKF